MELQDAVPSAPAQAEVEIGVQASPLQRWHGTPRHGADGAGIQQVDLARGCGARSDCHGCSFLTQIAPFVLDFAAASMNSTPSSPSATVGNRTSPSGRWPPRAARIAWAPSV